VSVLARAVTLLVAFLAVVGGIFFVVVHILLAEPPTVDFTAGHVTGQPVNMTIMADPAEEMRSWTGPAEDTVRDRYLAAFGRALPALSPEELWFRMRGILAVVAVDRVEVYNQPTPGCVTPVAGEAARRWAITFLAAAMSAPPAAT